jgi:hypothetical protein
VEVVEEASLRFGIRHQQPVKVYQRSEAPLILLQKLTIKPQYLNTGGVSDCCMKNVLGVNNAQNKIINILDWEKQFSANTYSVES